MRRCVRSRPCGSSDPAPRRLHGARDQLGAIAELAERLIAAAIGAIMAEEIPAGLDPEEAVVEMRAAV